MSLRELLIELKVKADVAAATRLNTTLDQTKARVASLDTGLLALGSGTRDAARVSASALRELGGIAGAAGAEIASALAPAFAPFAERARAAAESVNARLGSIRTAIEASLTAPVRGAAAASFAALEARASAASASILGSLARVRTALQTSLAAPAQRVASSLAGSLSAGFSQVQGRAQVAASRVTAALRPITAAATLVRAKVSPILDPLAVAAARTRGVMSLWGSAVGSIAQRTAAALKDSIASATAQASANIQSWTSKVTAAARSAIAKLRTPAPAAPEAPKKSAGGSGLLGSVVGGAVGGALVLGAIRLKEYASRTLEAAGAIDDMRASTGMNTDAIQVWRAIAVKAGADEGALAVGAKKLSLAIASANNGNKEAVKLFEQLGVATKNADGSARPLGTVLREVGGALGDIEDPAARVELASKVLGKAGTALLPAFEGGTQAVNEQVEQFAKTAIQMDAGMIAKGAAAGDAIDALKLQFAQLGPVALGAFLPLITTISGTLAPLLPQIVAALTPIIEALSGGLKPVIEAIIPLFASTLKSVTPAIQQLAPVVAALVGQLVGAFAPALEQILPALVQILEALLPLVPTIVSALIPAIIALVPALVGVAQALVPLVQQLVPVLVQLINGAGIVIAGLASVITATLLAVLPVVSGAISALTATVDVVINAFKFLWAAVTGGPEAFSKASDAFGTALDGWSDALFGWGESIVKFFTGLVDGIVGTFKSAFAGVSGFIGLGDDAELSVKQVQENLNRGTAVAPRAANTTSTTNKNATLNDQRTVNISVTGTQSPAETGRHVASYVDQLQSRDTSSIMSEFAGA